MRRAFFASVVLPMLIVPRLAGAQGNPLGPEFRVNTYTTSAEGAPSVAADASGNFVVVWNSAQDPGYGNFGQRYASSGVALGPEFRVNSYTTGVQVLPVVSLDPTGNFVVVWASNGQDGSSYGVFGQRYASSGTPLGPEFRVNTYTSYGQLQAVVASDSSGNFVVVWESDQDGAGSGIYGQRYASSGAPLGPEFRVNTFTTGPQYLPCVAADATGNFVVVWESPQDGGGYGVFGQRYASSGAPLGPEFRVNTYTTANQYRPSVASDSSTGNFVVVWQSFQQDGSGYGVFGQRYLGSGTPLGPEFRVNSYTTSSQYRPAVTADSSGNFVVVWQSSTQDGSLLGIFGQRFASSGATLGPEFRVNTYTTNNQNRPSVAADAAGNFVVAWGSNTQDGSSFGVFGQRYSQIVPVELMHFSIE